MRVMVIRLRVAQLNSGYRVKTDNVIYQNVALAEYLQAKQK